MPKHEEQETHKIFGLPTITGTTEDLVPGDNNTSREEVTTPTSPEHHDLGYRERGISMATQDDEYVFNIDIPADALHNASELQTLLETTITESGGVIFFNNHRVRVRANGEVMFFDPETETEQNDTTAGSNGTIMGHTFMPVEVLEASGDISAPAE